MAQAKGILPDTADGTRELYRDPRLCGYFIGVTLRPDLDALGVQTWLKTISPFVDELVEREPAAPGQAQAAKVAAVAIGLAPSFFLNGDAPRFGIDPPAAFDRSTNEPPNVLPWDSPSPSLTNAQRLSADVLFYAATIYEARIARFVEKVAATAPDVTSITIARGFQRIEQREPFGYRDGVRNMPHGVRSEQVFAHVDADAADEPHWADGGSYMAYMRIVQHHDVFAALADDATRDGVFGRHMDGHRLDTPNDRPGDEPALPVPALPPSSHVAKAGPRGAHDDTQIFRRGLPFIEAIDGKVVEGLNFVSFQASLDTFDTVLNDWILNQQFPLPGAGADALLDPAGGLTTIESVGAFYVPPYDKRFVGATMFDKHLHPPREGRLVVRKRVGDPSDPTRRFERKGFVFRVLDSANQQVGPDFATTSAGRAVLSVKLTIGQSYTLVELSAPSGITVGMQSLPFQMTKEHQQLRLVNTITQPGGGYGG